MGFFSITPLFIVFFLGVFLERSHFLTDTFIDAVIEINYRLSLPVVVVFGTSGNINVVQINKLFFGTALLLPWLFIGTIIFSKYLKRDSALFKSSRLRTLLKIIIPLLISLVGFICKTDLCIYICAVALAITPTIDLAFKKDPSVFNSKTMTSWNVAKIYMRYILLHPIVIAGCLGFFLLSNIVWLKLFSDNTINMLAPVFLPLCLIVAGAKVGNIRHVSTH